MKKTLITYLFFAFTTNVFAQENLVLNPSFETYTACNGFVQNITNWDNAKNTPDFFSVCGVNSNIQVPLNYFGYQMPANGNAYTGLVTYDASTINYRELIIGKLSNALTVGQKYFVSFKVNRADSNYLCGYSTNNLGVKFSKTKHNLGFPDLSSTLINNSSHINANNILSDTLNWIKIKGSFIADSAYKYIMLGNFYSSSNTTIFNHGNGNIAYYFIDEVCVTTDSLYNEGYVTNFKNNYIVNNNEITVSPNPFTNNILIQNLEFTDKIKIINSLGAIYYTETLLKQNKLIISTQNWPGGIYYLVTNKQHKIIIKN